MITADQQTCDFSIIIGRHDAQFSCGGFYSSSSLVCVKFSLNGNDSIKLAPAWQHRINAALVLIGDDRSHFMTQITRGTRAAFAVVVVVVVWSVFFGLIVHAKLKMTDPCE